MADNTACVSNIISASVSSPRGSVGALTAESIPCDFVSNDIVIDIYTITESGRVLSLF